MNVNQTGKATPFDNTSNGFNSINTQDAIEEVKGLAANGSGGTFSIVFTGSGITSNEFLTVCDTSLASEDTQYVLPFACQLIAFSFMSDSNNRDSDIELHHCSGTATATTRDLIFQLRNVRSAFATDFTKPTFAAGDRICMYAADQGDDPSDVVVTLIFQITSLGTANTLQNFSGTITRTASGGTNVAFT